LDARLTTLPCKNIIVVKSKEVKTGWSNSQEVKNLAESSNEGCGSKRAVLALMNLIRQGIQMLKFPIV
jgi:hypothetical protein